MTIDQLKAEISRLPIADRLLLVEDTWDSIAENPGVLPVSAWQREELQNRYKAYQDGSVELRDWKSVHESIRDKYK